MQTIFVRATVPQVQAAIAGLIPQLTGQAPDQRDFARGLQTRIGATALSLIQESFIDKARGGGGADGEPWAPLAPSTIARRQSKRPHGVLTRFQATRKLREAYQDLANAVGPKQNAARKRRLEKAKRQFDKAYAPIEILRDTGTMFNSLSPGVHGPSNKPGQVFRMSPGEVIVGTNVPYAKYHQTGTSRMPQRRLWPEPSRWPSSWRRALGEAARSGVIRAVVLMLTGRVPR